MRNYQQTRGREDQKTRGPEDKNPYICLMTDLSIIIVTYKGWNRLDKCLSAISSFSGSRYSKEIIIVDNTPDPEEISYIRKKFPGFKYVHNPVNGGYGYAINKGARLTSSGNLLILNPDTVATEPAIDRLIDESRIRSGLEILSCRQVNERGKECIVTGYFPAFSNLTGLLRTVFKPKPHPEKDKLIYPDWVSGSVLFFRRETFGKLNGFDEDFWMYFEDVDICKRVCDMGGEIILLNDISIEHNHGGSSRSSLKTTAQTKTEVHISRHVYIHKHKKGLSRSGIQVFLVINNIFTNLLTAIPGLILFFIPKLFIRTLIFMKLISYYLKSAANGTWLSPQSVNYRKSQSITG